MKKVLHNSLRTHREGTYIKFDVCQIILNSGVWSLKSQTEDDRERASKTHSHGTFTHISSIMIRCCNSETKGVCNFGLVEFPLSCILSYLLQAESWLEHALMTVISYWFGGKPHAISAFSFLYSENKLWQCSVHFHFVAVVASWQEVSLVSPKSVFF